MGANGCGIIVMKLTKAIVWGSGNGNVKCSRNCRVSLMVIKVAPMVLSQKGMKMVDSLPTAGSGVEENVDVWGLWLGRMH